MAYCRLAYEKHRVIIEASFDEGFVEELKYSIPSGYRTWDADRKRWTVYTPHMTDARKIAFAHYPATAILEVNKEHLEFAEQAKKAHDERARQNQRRSYQDPFESFRANYQNFEQGRPTQTNLSVFFVTDNAPKEVIQAAYKALARLYHPDNGGDTTKMQKLNAAYDQVKKGW